MCIRDRPEPVSTPVVQPAPAPAPVQTQPEPVAQPEPVIEPVPVVVEPEPVIIEQAFATPDPFFGIELTCSFTHRPESTEPQEFMTIVINSDGTYTTFSLPEGNGPFMGAWSTGEGVIFIGDVYEINSDSLDSDTATCVESPVEAEAQNLTADDITEFECTTLGTIHLADNNLIFDADFNRIGDWSSTPESLSVAINNQIFFMFNYSGDDLVSGEEFCRYIQGPSRAWPT